MTHIVALIGLKGAGKTTAADMLCQNNGFGRIKFADPLKNMLRSLFYCAGYDEEETELYIEGELKETPVDFLMGKSARHAMQTLGTEWGRQQIHEQFWVNMFGAMASNRALVVVDDLRFPNEAEFVVSQGGILIRIVGGKELEPDYMQEDLHESEALIATIPVHHHVVNDGSIADLYKAVYDVAFEKRDTRHEVRVVADQGQLV